MTFINPDSLPTRTFGEVVSTQNKIKVPAETSALIENFIFIDDIVKAFYESKSLKKYFEDNDIHLLDFGGGEFGITASMIVDIQPIIISRIKKPNGKTIGHKMAREILARAKEVMKAEPGY
jgi:hypothetical protein